MSKNKPVKVETPLELLELEKDLLELNPDVFKGVNHKKKLELLKSFSVTLIQEKSHSGPLPDPESLVEYDSVIPDGANRIMVMAEKQQDHRISMEKTVVEGQTQQSRLGQYFGLIIGIVGILSGTYLASIGATTVGGIIAGGTVVSLVSVFVLGKKQQQK